MTFKESMETTTARDVLLDFAAGLPALLFAIVVVMVGLTGQTPPTPLTTPTMAQWAGRFEEPNRRSDAFAAVTRNALDQRNSSGGR